MMTFLIIMTTVSCIIIGVSLLHHSENSSGLEAITSAALGWLCMLALALLPALALL